ncbi:hypothetical protein E0I56_022930 [Escherichia coli]|nr:hypothetical protein [Escherichia coli]
MFVFEIAIIEANKRLLRRYSHRRLMPHFIRLSMMTERTPTDRRRRSRIISNQPVGVAVPLTPNTSKVFRHRNLNGRVNLGTGRHLAARRLMRGSSLKENAWLSKLKSDAMHVFTP